MQGFAMMGVEKFDKAAELFSKSIEIEQNADVYMDLGNAYASMNEYDNAVDSFSKALLLEPNYESRKSQVSSVKNKVYDASDDYVNNINSKIDDLAGALGKAITGISDVTTLKNNVLEKKEKIGTSDGYLSSFDSNLASEISDCNTKISALEGDISSLNRQYNAVVEAEREAAKKAAQKIFNV